MEPERISPAASTPGQSRLQGTRVAIAARPQSRTNGIGAGQQITLGVATNVGRQPCRGRFGPDEYEHGRTGESALSVAASILERNLFHATVSVDGVDLGLFVDDHIGGCPNPIRQVFRHAGSQRATNEQMHLARRAALGQKHDGLSGRVARANDRDVGAVVQVSFDGRTGIVDARAGKAIRSVGLQAPPVNSEREQNDTTANLRAAIQMKHMEIVGGLCRNQLLDVDRGDNPGTELEHLQDAARGELGAAQSGWKTDEILDARRAAGLASRSQAGRASRSKDPRTRHRPPRPIQPVPLRQWRNRPPAPGQCLQMPAPRASSCKDGFTRIWPSPHSMTGVFRGEPSALKTFWPSSVSGSNQVKGTKFL